MMHPNKAKKLSANEAHAAAAADLARDAFISAFANQPDHIALAPGRVNLIGEHIDYNDGFVMPMAIERYTAIAASLSDDRDSDSALVFSAQMNESIRIPLKPSSTPQHSGWGKYLEGVLAGFAGRGIPVPPFHAVVSSRVPQGGGLSSSAALEVATATLLEALTGHQLSPLDKALLCQTAEHDFAGVPCGIMDQFSSVFGIEDQLMLIDCRSQQCEMVPFDAAGLSILITNSNVQHELSGGEYAARRSDCDTALPLTGKASWRDVTHDDVASAKSEMTANQFKRSRHIVSEIARTIEAADAFRQGRFDEVGTLMMGSHQSLRDDFEVSCHELDTLVDIATEIGVDGGVLGARMTGGGFGGCIVSLVKDDQIDSVCRVLASSYQQRCGLECSSFASRPARGAHLWQSES